MISFEWNDKKYYVGSEAYNHNHILLPEGKLLYVGGWLESLPPQPTDIKEVPFSFATESEKALR